MMCFSKKAAMFGLDARIALAIFGTLSVIMGAALYSAIQKSRAVAVIATLEAHVKAVEAYLIDTGQNIPGDPDHTPPNLQIGELITSTAPGWKGPYLPYPASSIYTLDWDALGSGCSPLFDFFQMRIHRKDGWANLVTPICVIGSDCMYFAVGASSDFTLGFVKRLDLLVDGSDTQFTGKFRYQDWGSDGEYEIFLVGPTAF